MPPLRRHQLAWLSDSGWQRVLAREAPAEVGHALLHWREHRLPMVVTRQPAPRLTADAPVHLGLPTPSKWGRHLVCASLPPDGLRWFSEFPWLHEAADALPRSERLSMLRLDLALRAIGVRARVYGGAGWQWLSGLDYLHDRSDLDLWLAVNDARHADRAARVLQGCTAGMRVDGELMFPDGRAVAWREWQAWRAGRQARVLVKGLDRVALQASPNREEELWARAA